MTAKGCTDCSQAHLQGVHPVPASTLHPRLQQDGQAPGDVEAEFHAGMGLGAGPVQEPRCCLVRWLLHEMVQRHCPAGAEYTIPTKARCR
jgi:hypothetical protein